MTAWLHSWELDHQLAAGASPQASAALEARARRIVGSRNRRRVADGLARTLSAAGMTRPVFTAAARPRAKEVLDASTVLATLDRHLRGSEPVAPAAIAMLQLLLTDCTSPLYQHTEAGGLGSRLRAAAAALRATEGHANASPDAARDEAHR